LPLIAQAKILSFFLNPSKGDSAIETSPNSQKTMLLQATVTLNPSIGGGDINIIDGDALLSESSPANNQSNILIEGGQISVYVVREGDTLSQIADMFDVSANTVRWSNDIKGSTIKPGQTLVILPISGIRHAIKSGDTLQSIAKLYKGDAEEILFYNNISGDAKLVVGNEIIVPNGVIVEAALPSKSAATTSSGAPASTGSPVYEGYYMRPIAGGVKTQGVHGYNGVDLAASVGTPILAAANGVVTVSRNSGWNGGYGNYVVISHPNGTQTLYAHNRQNYVVAGEQVSQGQVIAEIGSTGQSTGNHVHFEVRGARNPF
jgi:murein DD-endopeptidase MepM/ murein hydrolase activator NlpD